MWRRPRQKQVFRKYDDAGQLAGDVLSLEGDHVEGERLIQLVMKDGRRVGAPVPLAESRQRTLCELSRLSEPLRKLPRAPDYPVAVFDGLRKLAKEVDATQLGMISSEQLEVKSLPGRAIVS